MKQLELSPEYGAEVRPAIDKSEQNKCPAMAMILQDGSMITGKTTNILTAASSLVLNCVKQLADIPDDTHLISPSVLEPMLMLKEKILRRKIPLLGLEEVLNALSICAATNPTAEKCLLKLQNLDGCEAHSSHMISKSDESALKQLGINITCAPEFPSEDLYYM